MYFPRTLLYHEKHQFAIVIALLGLLLTWQLSRVNLGEVFGGVKRRTAGRRTSLIVIAALALSSVLFLMLGGFLVKAGAWANLDLCEMPRTAIVSHAGGAGVPARSPQVAVSGAPSTLPADFFDPPPARSRQTAVVDAAVVPSFDDFIKQEERRAANAARRPRR